jgi:hypothetical protein
MLTTIKTTMVEVEHSMNHAIIKNNDIDMNVYVIHKSTAQDPSHADLVVLSSQLST